MPTYRVYNPVTRENFGLYDSYKDARKRADKEDSKYGKSVNAVELFKKVEGKKKKKSKLKIS